MRRAALFLDFDGTLVDIAPGPDAVVVDPGLSALLGGLGQMLGGALALVSGRDLASLTRFVDGPGLVLAGSHGHELRLGDGRVDAPARPPVFDRVKQDLARFASAHPGLAVEDKALGVALHSRAAPEHEAAARAEAERLAAAHGLVVQAGKCVAELRLDHADKGTAIARIMDEPGFAGRWPVFVGDDRTDEAGFVAAARLGGDGVYVGDPPHETAAAFRLPDPAAVRAWLAAELAAGQRGG